MDLVVRDNNVIVIAVGNAGVDLTNQLRILLELCLLKECGFEVEKIRTMTCNQQRYMRVFRGA